MTTANAEPSPVPDQPSANPPSPAPSQRSGLRATFGAFRIRNYRLYVSSQILTNTCGWMQRIAQDWLMLTLTGDVAMVGLTVALQFSPILAFGLFGGVIADRYDKRRILMITQSIMGVVALTLGLLTLTGVVAPWHVLAMAALLGVTTVVDNPARQSFVPELVGLNHLRAAISLNASVFQLGALVGPMLAAVSIELVGEGFAFVANSGACMLAVVLLVVMRRRELNPPPAVSRSRGQLREGLAGVRRHPRLLWPTVLVGFVAISGINLATVLTAYADEVFESGAGGYGMLSAMVAVGAIAGSLATTQRHARLRQLVFGAAVIGVLEIMAATMGHKVAFSMVLVAVGMAILMYLTSSNALVQSTSAPTMRGRVMALYIVVLLGAQALSGVLIGWIASTFSPQVAMAACGIGPLLGALVIGIALARRGRLRPRVILRDRPGRGFVYIVPRTRYARRHRAPAAWWAARIRPARLRRPRVAMPSATTTRRHPPGRPAPRHAVGGGAPPRRTAPRRTTLDAPPVTSASSPSSPEDR
ncbi:MFS transporter [Phytoactinopolyspora limicola]|uniref:MFS transporter n=1 Tax=Phytoactinopolyspora limicola TaxID=2715536 RepID=UPI00140CD7B6|nr:MFS transporter [Phytoactinopolyspora limicola]